MQEAATSSSVICEGSNDASAQHILMLVEIFDVAEAIAMMLK
jgi:hypothetical protein